MGVIEAVTRSDQLSSSFNRLFVAAIVSNLGDGIRIAALPLLAKELTTDPLAIGAVTAATMAPWLLGPLGGAIVDRGDRVRLMVRGQVMRGVAVALLAAAVVTGEFSLWMVYAVAVAIGIGEVIVDSAVQASVPALVEEHQLERANGRLVAGVHITGDAFGAALGGWLFAAGAALPFILDAGTFLLAGLILASLTIPRALPRRPVSDPPAAEFAPTPKAASAPPPRTPAELEPTLLDDIRDGLAHLWQDPLLRPLAIVVGLVNVGLTAALSLLVLLVTQDLGAGDAAFGVLLGVSAGGGIVGSLTAERIREHIGRAGVLVGSSVAVAVAMAVLSTSSTIVLAGAAVTAIMFAGGLFNVVGQSLRMLVIPEELLGRVIATFRVIGVGGIPVGAFAGGLLSRAIGLRPTFVVAAGLLTVVAVAMVVTVRRIPAEYR